MRVQILRFISELMREETESFLDEYLRTQRDPRAEYEAAVAALRSETTGAERLPRRARARTRGPRMAACVLAPGAWRV